MKNLRPSFSHMTLFTRLFGRDVYAVGGFVRDLVRGKCTDEVDLLITRHRLDEIIKKIEKYGKVDLVGRSFGVIKFNIKGKIFDIALPREDAPKGNGIKSHKDLVISYNPNLPVEKDLVRRDFRCNSMALRLADGLLVDPFRGSEDAKQKIIKLTSPAAFPDDPLRVLRAARFASVLGFTVDPEIYGISKDIILTGLSPERIVEELFKILLDSERPSVGLNEMLRLSVLRQLFPELYRMAFSIQDSLFHPEKDADGHHTVWHHTLLTVNQAKKLADVLRLESGKKLALLMSALYHDVGKPAAAEWEYKKGRMAITNAGHDAAGEKITKRAFNRLKIFSWNGYNLRKMALLLIKNHHRASEIWQNRDQVTKKAFNRLAADINGEIELLIYLDNADRAGRREKPIEGLDRQAKWLLKKFQELNVSRETIKPLIMGRDLIKLGVPPGVEMGRILKRLYKLQLDGKFDAKSRGMEWAQRIIRGEKK